MKRKTCVLQYIYTEHFHQIDCQTSVAMLKMRYEEPSEVLDQVMVAKLKPEISGYWSELLEPSTVLELALFSDILTITSKLCLLLESHHKDFRVIHDVVEQSLITLTEMSEDQNHAGFESLKKSPVLMEKISNFNAEIIVSKRLLVDNSVTVEHFFSSITVLFIKARIV